MSFGWSASDIASAISVTYKLIQALDDAHGAASNYREAVAFLRDLLRVLEPLKTFTVPNAYPTYGKEIKKQLDAMRGPVEEFLGAVVKYEPHLGGEAKKGWKENMQRTVRKLDWYLFMEKKVSGLRGNIELHMRILDTLLQRLTLNVIYTGQLAFPEIMRETFQETIQPDFLVAIRECVKSSDTKHTRVLTMLSEHRTLMEDIKRKLENPEIIQQQIQGGILGINESSGRKALPGTFESMTFPKETDTQCFQNGSCQQEDGSVRESDEESLSSVCYFILLYFLRFVQGTMFALSSLAQPSRALTYTPLPKENITFLDAIGRRPRILEFDLFRTFKFFKGFVEQEFENLPGSLWVTHGKYLLMSLSNNQTLNEKNWNQMVAPGAKIVMSMIISKHLRIPQNSYEEICPERNCLGKWKHSKTRSWNSCPVCQKEVLTTVIDDSEEADFSFLQDQKAVRSSGKLPRQKTKSLSNENAELVEPELEPESAWKDISYFKRVVRVVSSLTQHSRSDLTLPDIHIFKSHFACHWHKSDPVKYCASNTKTRRYRNCPHPMNQDLRRIKEHFKYAHVTSQCDCCHAFFGQSGEQVAHRERNDCQPSDAADLVEGIDISQWLRIQRVIGHRGKTGVEKWFGIWDILFPEISPPAHPWKESIGYD